MPKRKQRDHAEDRDDVRRPYTGPAASGIRSTTECFGGSDNVHSIYHPLGPGQIRVLILHPGTFGTPLKASLHHVHLDKPTIPGTNDVRFEAISYAWGPQVFDKTIYINDGGTLNITASLYSALQHFRYLNRARLLWADAVCLNQLDADEKSKQIQRMMEVFMQASNVLVWLGPAEEDDGMVFAVLDAIAASRLCTSGDPTESVAALDRYLEANVRIYGKRIDALEGLHAVSRIINRQWFSRLWVVQEVVPRTSNGGNDVLLASGPFTAKWRSFVDAMYLLYNALFKSPSRQPVELSHPRSSLARFVEQLVEIFQTRYSQRPLFSALSMVVQCFSRECSIPHDRIYSIYGLGQLHQFEDLVPDYSLTVGELYRRFAMAILDPHTRGLRRKRNAYAMLALVGTESREAENDLRPTWVPHFHHLTERSQAKYFLYAHDRFDPCAQFGPGRLLRPVCKIDANTPENISLRGTCFATLDRVLPASWWPDRKSDELDYESMLKSLSQWYLRCRNFVRETFQSDDSHGARDLNMLKILTTGFPVPEQTAIKECDGKYSELIGQVQSDLVHLEHADIACLQAIESIVNVNDDEWRLIWDVLDRDRILCSVTTSSGRTDISWVPKAARDGDQLCVFAGSRFPFLLRESRDGIFKVLGDAWTLKVTLREALGARHECVDPDNCRKVYEQPSCNTWDTADAETKALVTGMDWITLE